MIVRYQGARPPLTMRVGRCRRCNQGYAWNPRRGYSFYELACPGCGQMTVAQTTRALKAGFRLLDDVERDELFVQGLEQRIAMKDRHLAIWREREGANEWRGQLIHDAECERADMVRRLANLEGRTDAAA